MKMRDDLVVRQSAVVLVEISRSRLEARPDVLLVPWLGGRRLCYLESFRGFLLLLLELLVRSHV